MKTRILLITSMFLITSLFAQDEPVTVTKLKKSDRVMIDLSYDLWQEVPSNITLKSIQPGISISSMQDYPIGNSNFAFAYGLGFSAHNMHSNGVITYDSLGVTEFVSLPNDLKYKVNKFTLSYIDVPIEIRFRTKGVNPFKFYAGFKFGFLLQEHTKYSGDDPSTAGQQIKFKEFKHRNVMKYHFGPTVRIGYKWIGAFASYTMTPVFEKDKGPQMYPISFGITLMPY